MTERERKLLRGGTFDPMTQDEAAIKYAIDNAGSGGGGDTYETVAEIEVGTMAESPIYDGYYVPINGIGVENAPKISEADTYYFNDTDTASEQIIVTDEISGIVWGGHVNVETGEITRESSDKPFYMVTWVLDGANYSVNVVSSTNTVANTTVKILKKVSGGSITVDSELSETSENPVQNKVITAALADKMDADEIPEATASNNGKILGVNNGEYALIKPIYEVVLTPTGSGEYTATHNGDAVTVSEVMSAAANRNVVISSADNGVTVIMPVSSIDTTGNNLTFGAVVCTVSGQSLVEKRYYGIGFNDGTNDAWGMDTST